MSDIDFVVRKSKNLERRLEQEFGTKEEGLGKKTESVKLRLPRNAYENLLKLNRMRNDIVHKADVNQLNNKPEFKRLYKEIERSLNKRKRARSAPEWIARTGAFIIIILAIFVIYLLFQSPL